MSEKIKTSKKLCRGVLSEVARRHKISWTSAQMIADGVFSRPDVLADILAINKEALKEKARKTKIEARIQKLASKL